jgi:transcriptional regulator with XRE-family HTH domain
MKTSGDRISARMKELGITGRELAKQLDISPSTITSIRKGRFSPKKHLYELSSVLKVDPNWLMAENSKTVEESFESKQQKLSETLNQIKKEALHPNCSNIIPFVEKPYIDSHLSGQKVSTQAPFQLAFSFRVSHETFCFREDLEGMSPAIEPGSLVYVDPSVPMKNDGTPALFQVGKRYLLGMPKVVASGLLLEFVNKSIGWEPIKVQEEDFVGCAVAIVPIWQQQFMTAL